MHHRWRVLWGDVMGNLTVKESGEMINFISPNVSNITSFKVHFSPRQEGSGDPSPDNVREITGWNGVEGYGCGKNLFGGEAFEQAVSPSRIYEDAQYGKYLRTYNVTTANSIFIMPFKENTQYTFIGKIRREGAGIITGLKIQYTDGSNTHLFASTSSEANEIITVRTVSTKNKTIKGLYYLQRTVGCHIFFNDFGIFEGDVPIDDFEPYQGTTTSIDWTEDVGTVYGGYVDLVSGEMVQDFTKSTINDSTTITYRGISNGCAYFNIKKGDYGMLNQGNVYLFSNYCVKAVESEWNVWIDAIAGNLRIYVPSTYDSLAKFKAYLAEHPLDISYKILEPITHQLTPQQLSTLKGQNNFWSNADYVEIEYELTETFDIQKAKRKIILSQPHVETASGNIVTFDTDMKGKLKECKVYFSPVQEGSGDPSPDNIRNITGWNGITATRSGKNLVEVSAETRVYSNPTSNTKFTEDNNIIIITGSSNGGYRASCKPNTQYTYSCEPTLRSGGVYLRVWEEIGEEKNLIISQNVNSTKGAVATFTTGSDVYSLVVGFYVYSTAAQTGLTISDFQLELGDTRTAYEPYRSTAVSINWTDSAGTMYGGYVDLISGELVVNMAIVDLGTLTWTYNEQYTTFISYPVNLMSTSIYKKGLCSQYTITEQWLTSQEWADNDKIFNVGGQDSRIRIKDTTYTDVSTFKTSVDGVQFIYELADPIHYQLTPQQLTALRGANAIYSNANEQIDIKYWTRLLKINYMKDVQWLDHSYITSAGKLTEESTALSHTTVNSIFLPAGNYRIDGFCYQEPPANSLNCRVHEYSAGGSWVKLITSNTADTMSPYILEFSLDHDSYIKLSLPRLLDAKLIKI